MTRQTRYFCRTCRIEFVDGGWILVNNQQSRWTPADGCTRCRSGVLRIEFEPAVPGLDVPRDADDMALAALTPRPVVAARPEPPPAPLARAEDHYGTNEMLSPDPRAEKPAMTAVEPWQWI